MKTFIKMIIAVAALGFATANAETQTPLQKAIKAVTDVVATGDKTEIKKIVSQKVAEFPDYADQIVMAAINMDGVSDELKKIIIQTAIFTVPNKIYLITKLQQVSGSQGGTSFLITAVRNRRSNNIFYRVNINPPPAVSPP